MLNWTKAYDRHIKNADELALKAEKEKEMALLTESNASRKRSSEIKEHIEESNAKIMKLKDQLKKL